LTTNCSEMKWTLYWKHYFFHYVNVVFIKLEIPL
jgi:hypothetical protein